MIKKKQTDFSLLLSFLSGSLSSGLCVLTSYEQGPNLRIPSGHQNQTHGICPIEVKYAAYANNDGDECMHSVTVV